MQCNSIIATTAAPGKSTSAAVTSVPGAGGCPSFDFSTCDPSCVVMDAQGCMSCQCQGRYIVNFGPIPSLSQIGLWVLLLVYTVYCKLVMCLQRPLLRLWLVNQQHPVPWPVYRGPGDAPPLTSVPVTLTVSSWTARDAYHVTVQVQRHVCT